MSSLLSWECSSHPLEKVISSLNARSYGVLDLVVDPSGVAHIACVSCVESSEAYEPGTLFYLRFNIDGKELSKVKVSQFGRTQRARIFKNSEDNITILYTQLSHTYFAIVDLPSQVLTQSGYLTPDELDTNVDASVDGGGNLNVLGQANGDYYFRVSSNGSIDRRIEGKFFGVRTPGLKMVMLDDNKMLVVWHPANKDEPKLDTERLGVLILDTSGVSLEKREYELSDIAEASQTDLALREPTLIPDAKGAIVFATDNSTPKPTTYRIRFAKSGLPVRSDDTFAKLAVGKSLVRDYPVHANFFARDSSKLENNAYVYAITSTFDMMYEQLSIPPRCGMIGR